MDLELMKKTAQAILASKKVVALTGAGISVESGIPDFRGPSGLWEKYDPMEYATIDAFLANPQKVWMMLKDMGNIVEKAKPNPAHYALSKLEEMNFLSSVITQNIDNLHQASGSKVVIEFHGNSTKLVCLSCNRIYERREVQLESLPPRCQCRGVLKPNVVFFGEGIPWGANLAAKEEAEKCDLMLVIGTSAVVSPACDLPVIAKGSGAKIVEVNLEETQLTHHTSDWILKGSASRILQAILEEIAKEGTKRRSR